eukprot:CAMPEP_0201552208 /NCGR_PEP_ID=MMETSP0173_2-20130828/14551_1 /ASSEMBLY_ACC=CAM_ASM_000268 /TAXON_ID=218659 /ORGANISM="Vexillifera sp., Strain DIVA3 564/2" /LENGTH=250 /DNA_ID=CAMNT_0047962649 /DNA_START=31 /DNA_END=783 /DNA_ORIENTATION=-
MSTDNKDTTPTTDAAADQADDTKVDDATTTAASSAVEEIPSDDDMPALEEADDIVTPAEAPRKPTKAEKKARKALFKLGLKPVPGITRVTVKRPQQVLFVITRPEVFKCNNMNSYVIFGKAEIEDAGQDRFSDAAKAFDMPDMGNMDPAQLQAAAKAAGVDGDFAAAASAAAGDDGAAPDAAAAGGDDDAAGGDDVPPLEASADADGLEETDINLVMSQTGAERADAIAALKKNDGDIVNSIMSLTNVTQ